MRRIAAPWSRTFKGVDVNVNDEVINKINNLLTQFEESTTPLLEEYASEEVNRIRHELPGLLKAIAARVKGAVDKEQKEANRCLAPHIKEALTPGYDVAAPLSGPGSAARRKVRRAHLSYVLVPQSCLRR